MAHIFIIAGHGDGDPGASGNGYKEYERVRALAKKIKAYGGDNVTVGDTSRDWYKDNLISSLNISKDWQIVELHMDGASASSARGGHVIINSTYDPDKYDKALAEFISDILPGRASTIVKRSDLANPKRAAAKGYPYRLLECGFITNAQDVKIFNGQMDDIAKGILSIFGIKASGSESASKPDESKSAASTGKKSTDTIAKEVIAGKWGNGDDRKKKLEAAGYNYNTIQNRVNEMLGVKSSGTAKKTLKVGMKAKPKTAVSYDGVKLISSVTKKYYKVIEIKGSRVVLGDSLNTAFNISNLTY
ncbi:hypothetical protein FNY66_04525 [Mediterraneibacter catenae]|uniref:N-acetylmuramoyl-L-alanine amidase n=1 Tax=Mediterraneibacter catenae TaxID=2594882 RepID=A0A5M9HZ91_9FIRM|nr:N-acetylmuramoyl-L-alanine amidase [Mediterraneibacter catenae]KAA8502017.1 hypothetical protein FNY66_04525 [Mediterraneibacter catenae]